MNKLEVLKLIFYLIFVIGVFVVVTWTGMKDLENQKMKKNTCEEFGGIKSGNDICIKGDVYYEIKDTRFGYKIVKPAVEVEP